MLTWHRERMGFSHADLVTQTGIPLTRTYALERFPHEIDQAENPTLATVDLLARRFGIRIGDLVDPEPPPPRCVCPHCRLHSEPGALGR